ncbi:MAG: phosphoribosylanthranilate isomerase, partial [Dissulfurimicrobium sp.]
IKVCGLTDLDEARDIARLGVNAIGLVFARGPRQVGLDKAREIISGLPPFVQSVGVFVDEDLDHIRHAIDYCGLDLVQLHGKERPEMCLALAPRVIKAWRISSREDIYDLLPYKEAVRAFLLDAWSPHAHGGTGRTFDWSIALEAKEMLVRPIILAGGLKPENCAGAIGFVRPWGVDVSSGVELSPGRKDIRRVKWFVEEVEAISNVKI